MELEQLKAKEEEILSTEPLDTEALKEVQDHIASLEQQQAHEERVNQAATDYYSVIDNLDLGEGVTLRKLIPNPALYQLATIGLKNAFTAQIEPISMQNAQLQKETADLTKANDDLRAKLAKVSDENVDVVNENHQHRLEVAQLQQYRDNAAAQIDELNGIIEQKNGHIADLQGQIALGVRDQIKVVNSEDEERKKSEALAEYKRQYTIYAEEVLDFKRSKFKAKRAVDDSVVEYSNLEKPSYILIDDTQVSQFRNEYPVVAQDDHADSPLDQPVQTPASVEPPELTVPQFQVPDNIPTDGLADQEQGVQQTGAVTREEYEALKADVEVIKSRIGWVA